MILNCCYESLFGYRPIFEFRAVSSSQRFFSLGSITKLKSIQAFYTPDPLWLNPFHWKVAWLEHERTSPWSNPSGGVPILDPGHMPVRPRARSVLYHSLWQRCVTEAGEMRILLGSKMRHRLPLGATAPSPPKGAPKRGWPCRHSQIWDSTRIWQPEPCRPQNEQPERNCHTGIGILDQGRQSAFTWLLTLE